MPVKDQHIQPERGQDRHEVLDYLRKAHDERELANKRANPHFNKYMKDRQAAHEATKTRD